MLSKKEETSLAVEGGMSASTMGAAVGLETTTAAPHGREAISPRDHFRQSIEERFQYPTVLGHLFHSELGGQQLVRH